MKLDEKPYYILISKPNVTIFIGYMSTKSTGDKGEQLAKEFLLDKGYEILEENYRYKRAEIDLICLNDNLLVFVEVKTLSSSKFNMPEARVNTHKERMIIQAAENYIYSINWQKDIRFDILSIVLNQPPEFYHIEDAFY